MVKGQSSRPLELVRVLAIALATAGSAGAEGLDWINPAGGLFHDPANWDPPLVPGPKDTVFFRTAGTYTVDFAGDATTRWLRVYGGEVTLDLGAHTYDLDGARPEIVITSQPSIRPSARLVVRDGTLLASPEIAVTSDGAGSLELTGAGVSLRTGAACTVGLLGAGDLTVSAGAQGLIATDLIVGDLAGSSGALLVTGAGSRLATRDRHIRVGREGAASAVVSDGGVLVSGRSSFVGTSIGSHTALVTGAGSRWDSGFTFDIGQEGVGAMRIEQGGAGSSLGVTGIGTQGGDGTLTVTGAGSRWDVLDSAFVLANAGGTGRLAVLDGATASSTHGVSMGEIGAGCGEIVVSGAGSRLDVGDEMRIGYSTGSTGTVVVSDGGHLDLVGFIEVGRTGRGVLEISGGGTFSVTDQVFLGSQPSAGGSLTLIDGAGSLLGVGAALEVGFLAPATLLVTGGGRIVVGGTSVAGGKASGSAGVGLIGVGSSWTTKGELLIGGGGPATVTVSDDAVLAAAPVVVGGPGVLRGDGVVTGDVENGGTVRPGAVIGRLTVEGSFAQTPAGALRIELNGVAPGVGHDQLLVCGDAALDGALGVARRPGYEPAPGAEFEVVRTVGGSIHGAFSWLDADARYAVTYGLDCVRLTFLGESVPGDVNADGRVDFNDLLLLLAAWGACPEPPDPCPADLDDDGTVGFSDLLLLLANWT